MTLALSKMKQTISCVLVLVAELLVPQVALLVDRLVLQAELVVQQALAQVLLALVLWLAQQWLFFVRKRRLQPKLQLMPTWQ
jgi:hypothetical protein